MDSIDAEGGVMRCQSVDAMDWRGEKEGSGRTLVRGGGVQGQLAADWRGAIPAYEINPFYKLMASATPQ